MREQMIGIDVDDLRLGTKEGLRKAAALQFRAVELSCVSGEIAPENLSTSGRRHFFRYVDSLGLHLVALRADMPGLRMTDPSTVQERVERTCEILELARTLNVSGVTASVGALTHPDTGELSPAAHQALSRIGEVADGCGVTFHLRPAHDSADRLVAIMDRLGCDAIRVGMDPAALVMSGVNPMAVLEKFAGKISLVHVRDGSIGFGEQNGRETNLGEGDVDWIGLLSVLSSTDYSGPYLLRRSDSPQPEQDLCEGRDTLERLLPPG